ncbi:MAG: hypothetical protein ACTSRZ_09005 [Promethearchaeota archaeon]
MVKTKTKIYENQNEEGMENMVEIAELTLKELGMAVKTQYLDKTLVELTGTLNNQKNNVTLYHEGDKIYVKYKCQIGEIEDFWSIFESKINIFGDSSEETIQNKTKIVDKIYKAILDLGYPISEDDCWDFLLNFEEKYNALPDEEQIQSIALSYSKLCEEQGITPGTNLQSDVFIEEEEAVEEDSEISTTEVLKEIIKEIPTLTKEDKSFFISLFDDLTVEQQKKLVSRIKAIESDLDKIPYLTMDERAKIRKDIMNLSTEKRRAKILKIINKRKKDLDKYAHIAMEEKLKKALDAIPSLSDLEKDIHLARLSELSVEDKKKYLGRLRSIQNKFEELKEAGLDFSDSEMRVFRDELIRMGKEQREKRFKEIIEEKRYEMTKEELFKEIPAMRFEKFDKIVKELMWLEVAERKKRIKAYKDQFLQETEKKSKAFEESKVGSTCPNCGWPIGMFTKKCPRCGKKFGFQL